MRRVAVTGMGIVSCIGNNTQEVLSNLREGKSGISKSEEHVVNQILILKIIWIKKSEDLWVWELHGIIFLCNRR